MPCETKRQFAGQPGSTRPLNGAAHLTVNGKAVENLQIVRGYATLHRRWKSGDVVQLTLDMPAQLVKANAISEFRPW